MDISYYADSLERNVATLHGLIQGVAAEQARWRPDADAWSILEVINHLYDEEREDFRQRFDLILHRPDAAWPPIHPGTWVTERRYNERDLADSWQAFADERAQSLAWLRGLADPDLNAATSHPAGFTMRAGDMLAAWVAHDFLHSRQLVELHYLYHAQQATQYDVRYAGDY